MSLQSDSKTEIQCKHFSMNTTKHFGKFIHQKQQGLERRLIKIEF